MTTRLRHIAIIVPDPETAAQFFEHAFDMKRAGTGRRGIYMSDGVMNVALLKRESDDEPIGLYHFGMWVDDLAESEKKVFDAGGTYLAGFRDLLFRFVEIVDPHAEVIEAFLLVALGLQQRDVHHAVRHIDAAPRGAGPRHAERVLEEFGGRFRIGDDDRDVAKACGHGRAPDDFFGVERP